MVVMFSVAIKEVPRYGIFLFMTTKLMETHTHTHTHTHTPHTHIWHQLFNCICWNIGCVAVDHYSFNLFISASGSGICNLNWNLFHGIPFMRKKKPPTALFWCFDLMLKLYTLLPNIKAFVCSLLTSRGSSCSVCLLFSSTGISVTWSQRWSHQ